MTTDTPVARPAMMRLDPLQVLLFLAGILIYLSFGYTEMAGSDLWWHLAAGRELFQTGTPWMVDDWSYSALGHDWLNHEWFADIIFWSWASAFGQASLVYWKWLVVIVTFCLLQWTLQRQTGNGFAALVCAALAAAIAAPFIDIRPHLYSLLFYCLLLCLLLGKTPRRWLLALIFLVWVNLHGGFFFGLMALGVLLFPWRNFSLLRLRTAFLTGLLCLAAAAINPSGFETFLYPLVYAFDSSSPYRGLGEWLPPFKPGGIRSPLFFYFMWAPLLALVYAVPAVRKRLGDVPWEGLVLTGLTLAMALTSRRFIPIFGISLALLLAPLAGLVFDVLRHRALQYLVAMVFISVGVARLWYYPLQAAPAFHYLTAEYTYPEDMVSFMQANDLHGKVFALYNWGGYLHLRTDGAMKVYIDGRADTLYSADEYNLYVGVLRGMPGWIDVIEGTGAQYILWPAASRNGPRMLERLLASKRWRLVYQDAVSFLVVRNGVPIPEKLKASPGSPARDLTVAMNAARENRVELALVYTRRVREAVPWQKTACQLQVNMLRFQDHLREAADVLQECRGWFPTDMLN
ncbi:hypothetical protein E4634_16525 [Mangrovimicrobium sediminis]|uniref:Glycosyltransferase RgtA/B/C/D-like domain-containing protein n=1 Tax=Mangrovimicrobium sediminis TaxID=2562682 RepID=A0A4Z0LWX2_9GAMM|nr:hypothetical protein [Haliea sp. SAOS-164]TGD71724.1 hypothetical protein E4634_16525 [Haliea sp. SAOS-164]